MTWCTWTAPEAGGPGEVARLTEGKEATSDAVASLIALIIVGVASFFVLSRNADFPGAGVLRTAGQEVSERMEVNGAGEEARASTPPPPPILLHHDMKLYMLGLINSERTSAGVPPVTLGDNIAAQLHAESSLANCFSGHWGVDGLKTHMRYPLAGGYQANAENGSGSDYCIRASDR